MYPIYKCLNCGRIWRSGEIIVVCPICRSKPIKIKKGVDINKVTKRLKSGFSGILETFFSVIRSFFSKVLPGCRSPLLFF